MSRELFGTDGIRGLAGTYPLNQQGAKQIGKAVAAHFAKPGELVVVGRDPRESSPMLSKAVIQGLMAMDVRVEDLGIIPTPGLAYLTRHRRAKAGVMITASHNPYTDNGIKVFSGDGDKLPDGVEESLNSLINSKIASRGAGSSATVESAITDYQVFLAASAGGGSFKGLGIAIDSANGATSGLAEKVFHRLGAAVVPLFDKPNGTNINVSCGATDTAALQAAVKARKLGAGIAFDGDGDRLMLVDELGRQLSGDHILYILAVSGHQKGVVATLMSNMGLETALKQHNIVLHRTSVGDRYVLEGLAKTGLSLGGEQSGHIILSDYSGTGDGLLVAIRTLLQVQASGKSLAQWYDEMPLLPQALVNIALPDKSLLERSEFTALIAECSDEFGASGRLNIRPSGTEPKLRIMVESSDAAERAQSIADRVSALFESLETQVADVQ